MHIKRYSDLLHKIAEELEPANDNISQRFHNYARKAQQAGMGALYGPVGYLAASVGSEKETSKPEQLPDFDPRTGAYIGKAYKLPEDEQGMLALHKKIVGKDWEPSAPRILEWLLAKRTERIQNAIREAIIKGKAEGADLLSAGEKASILFPRILMNNGKVKTTLGILNPYPIHYGWKDRPLSAEDFKDVQKDNK